MTLDIGKRRVMSRNRFRNTVNNFVGADWQLRNAGGGQLRAFYLVPMRHLPTDRATLLDNGLELDRASRDTAVLGIFYEPREFRGDTVLEAYALDYEAKTGDAESTTDFISVGARAYRLPRPGDWQYEVELIIQGGESGDNITGVPHFSLRHSARFDHFEVGYVFDAPWETNVSFQYDHASGDGNPLDARNERFNTLFGDRRFDFGPTGIFGPFQRSNLETPGIRVAVTPTPRWQGMLSWRSMRLASSTDTWAGTGLRDSSGDAGRSLGLELEASATWATIPNRLSLEVGFAALKLGRFGRQTLGSAEPRAQHYWYAALTTTF